MSFHTVLMASLGTCDCWAVLGNFANTELVLGSLTKVGLGVDAYLQHQKVQPWFNPCPQLQVS